MPQANIGDILKRFVAIIGFMTLAACAQQGKDYSPEQPYDPLEPANRAVHSFNKGLDRGVVRPVSKGYVETVPAPFQTAISNFSRNAEAPASVINNVLRMDMVSAFEDLGRFAINTTAGAGGILDPATELGMPALTDTDFGQVLYAMDVGEGPYLELPLLGPSTARRAVGRFVDMFTNPLAYVIPAPGSTAMTTTSIGSRLGDRGRYADTIDSVLYDSADSYAQARLLYLQNRRYKLGKGPGDDYLDPYSGAGGASSEAAQSSTTTTQAASAAYEDPYDG